MFGGDVKIVLSRLSICSTQPRCLWAGERNMAKESGKKVYRLKHEGSITRDRTAQTTKIVLTKLTCNTTEDNAGADECEIRIWADNKYQSHRRNMDNGEVWPLNITMEFSYKVKVQLWDLDNPGFPLYDDHDRLGTITINPGQTDGSGTFGEDGADYTLDWIPG